MSTYLESHYLDSPSVNCLILRALRFNGREMFAENRKVHAQLSSTGLPRNLNRFLQCHTSLLIISAFKLTFSPDSVQSLLSYLWMYFLSLPLQSRRPANRSPCLFLRLRPGLSSFMSSRHKLKSSERREHQLRECFPETGL